MKEVTVGDIYGSWKVVKLAEKKAHEKWECLCSCGNIQYVFKYNLVRGLSTGCVNCRSLKKEKGIENKIWKNFLYGAKTRNLEVGITFEEFFNLLVKQEYKCALSGVSIKLKISKQDTSTASLDRINSSLGYIRGNVQWVHKVVNRMKSNMSDTNFITTCKLVASNRPSYEEF